MFIASVIKHTLVRHPRILLSSNLPRGVRLRRLSNALHRQTTTLIWKPSGLHFRQFSCSCVTGFRTAGSFIGNTDHDDSEESGNEFLIVIELQTSQSITQFFLFSSNLWLIESVLL